jgi:EasF-like predicted methyltransferase
VKVLLDALDAAEKNVSYFALDLMRSELERTLAAVPKGTFKHVQCFGLHGTYDDGLEWLQQADNADRPKVVLSLGSSIGNFTRVEAVRFVKQFADILSPADRLLFGVDACQESEKVYHAYNDAQGITNQFTLNGLKHANKLLGHTAFDMSEWDAIGHYDEQDGRHQAFVTPKKDVTLSLLEGVHVNVHAGEKIRIEESYKYSPAQAQELWRASSVIEGASWTNHTGSYSKSHLLKIEL